MELREILLEGFDYDLWANRKWVFALGGFNHRMLDAQQILEHILTAQRVWLDRCGVQVVEFEENVGLSELFALYTEAWQAQVADRALTERIMYQNRDGLVFEDTLEQIARHVINHGTYHRGHLRGLAGAEGLTSFPDTDLIFYFREME